MNNPSAPAFRIFIRTSEGVELQVFTWRRDAASGIARARREGPEFGYGVTAVWAEAICSDEWDGESSPLLLR